MSAPTEYYYADAKGQRKGPYTLAELQQLRLPANARVWHEGLQDWISARQLPELEGHLRAVPPPLAARPWYRRPWVWIVAAVLIVAGIITLYLATRPGGEEEERDWSKATPAEKERRKAEELAHPERFLQITHHMRRNLINQAVVTYSIHNRAAFTEYLDVDVHFDFLGESDTSIMARYRTLYLKIPPGGTSGGKLKFFVDRQATRAKLTVVSAHANDRPTGADSTATLTPPDTLTKMPEPAAPVAPPAPAH